MDPQFRVVPDINTAVSGYLWAGPSRRVIDAAAGRLISLLLSEDLIREAAVVLRSPKFARQMVAAASDASSIIDTIRRRCELDVPAAISAPFRGMSRGFVFPSTVSGLRLRGHA